MCLSIQFHLLSHVILEDELTEINFIHRLFVQTLKMSTWFKSVSVAGCHTFVTFATLCHIHMTRDRN